VVAKVLDIIIGKQIGWKIEKNLLSLSIIKRNMNVKFTGAEKVLFKMTYEFAINVEKLSEEDAIEKAINKVIMKRALGKQLKKEGFTY
jgi:hypothetical protein